MEEVQELLGATNAALWAASSTEEKLAALSLALEAIRELFPPDEVQYVGPTVGPAEGAIITQRHRALMAGSLGLLELADRHGCREEYEQLIQGMRSRRPWGSGKDGEPLTQLCCANIDVAAGRVCPNPGSLICSRCQLVAYCSKACQKQHFKAHKIDCRSSLAAPEWKPWWEREGRPAPFVRNPG